mmetsp:Transcript_5795/g.11409  ORF Transcript_5795/g.11409 Transcript_5795/m.11409 type:complete len:348 (+) Transcript_5795:2145-3188(+)
MVQRFDEHARCHAGRGGRVLLGRGGAAPHDGACRAARARLLPADGACGGRRPRAHQGPTGRQPRRALLGAVLPGGEHAEHRGGGEPRPSHGGARSPPRRARGHLCAAPAVDAAVPSPLQRAAVLPPLRHGHARLRLRDGTVGGGLLPPRAHGHAALAAHSRRRGALRCPAACRGDAACGLGSDRVGGARAPVRHRLRRARQALGGGGQPEPMRERAARDGGALAAGRLARRAVGPHAAPVGVAGPRGVACGRAGRLPPAARAARATRRLCTRLGLRPRPQRVAARGARSQDAHRAGGRVQDAARRRARWPRRACRCHRGGQQCQGRAVLELGRVSVDGASAHRTSTP